MIYKKIKEICKEREISICALEKKAGLSNGIISKWNNSSPTIDKLQAVAKALELEVKELLE